MLWCFLQGPKCWSVLGFKIPTLQKSVYIVLEPSIGGDKSRPFSGWIPWDAQPLGAVLWYRAGLWGLVPHSQPCVWDLLLTIVYMYHTPTRVYPVLPSLINFLFSHKRKLELSLPYLAAEGSWPTVPGGRDVGGVSQAWEPACYLSTAERRLGARPIFF